MDPIYIQKVNTRNIHISDNTIPKIFIPNWMNRQPNVDNLVPPVVIDIGNPIVEIPGCVKMHKDDKQHKNGIPIDKNMVENDPDQAMTICPNGSYPSYDAMNYEPEQLIITRETPPPPVAPPPTPPEFKADEIPDTKQEEVPCPGPGQLRVGDVTQSGDERVIGHKLSDDGKICETLYEPTSAIEKYLPPVNQASTVTALAVVATAGAAATPLLIRIIRPIIKKIWTTIQKKLGKEVRQLSKSEIQTNKYREKKGLPPIKRK